MVRDRARQQRMHQVRMKSRDCPRAAAVSCSSFMSENTQATGGCKKCGFSALAVNVPVSSFLFILLHSDRRSIGVVYNF